MIIIYVALIQYFSHTVNLQYKKKCFFEYSYVIYNVVSCVVIYNAVSNVTIYNVVFYVVCIMLFM